MTRPSLRWIFLVPILIAIVVGFTAFAIYADQVERDNRLADIDAELVRAAGRNEAEPVGDQPPSRPPEDDTAPIADNQIPIQLLIDPDGTVVSTGASGNPFSASTIQQLLTLDGFHTVSADNVRVRVTTQDNQLTSATALSLDLFDQATTDFRRAVAIGGGIIVTLVAAIVWLLVQSLTRPISRITSAATRIADGELDTEIDARNRSQGDGPAHQ